MIFLISLNFYSCNSNQTKNNTETISDKSIKEIAIIYYNHHNDTLEYSVKDLIEIKVLAKLLTETNDEIKDTCQPSGKLIYKYSDNSKLILEFSSSKSNEFAECNFVKHKSENIIHFNSLPKDAEILIDNILWRRLKWSSIKMAPSDMTLYKDT